MNVLVIVLLTVVVCTLGADRWGKYTVNTDQKSSVQDIILESQAASLVRCVQSCQLVNECESVNYVYQATSTHQQSWCQLLRGTGGGTPEAGWKHVTVKTECHTAASSEAECWGEWSTWSPCSTGPPSYECIKTRSRTCLEVGGQCVGNSTQRDVCPAYEDCFTCDKGVTINGDDIVGIPYSVEQNMTSIVDCQRECLLIEPECKTLSWDDGGAGRTCFLKNTRKEDAADVWGPDNAKVDDWELCEYMKFA